MNSNHLLDAIGEARDQYILSAVESRNGQVTKKLDFKKTLLVAAVIAMTLMLVGCAAVYVLHLQDMKIAEESYTKRFDEYGKLVAPTEVTVDILVPLAAKDSPNQQAAREWLAFMESYDQDEKRRENTNVHGIPENYYYTYDCYTWGMVSKLDEIAQKYDLKLLDMERIAQRYQTGVLFEAMGIPGVMGQRAEHEGYAASFHSNGNFWTELSFTLTGEDSLWDRECIARYYYGQSGYFDPTVTHVVTNDCDQWSYTTADGTEVLLALSKGGDGMIFAEQSDASIYIAIDPGLPFVREEGDLPTRRVLEQMADVFSYTIQPNPLDLEDLLPKLDAAEAEYQVQRPTFVSPFPEYSSYSEFLDSFKWVEDLYYTLYDVNSDGQEDLLLGSSSDSFHTVKTMRDGLVKSIAWTPGIYQLCQDGCLEESGTEYFSDVQNYTYWDVSSGEQTLVGSIMSNGGGFFKSDDDPLTDIAISQEEFQAIRDSHGPMSMEMSPVLYFPMDDGSTMEQHMRKNDPRLTEAEIIQIYQEYAAGPEVSGGEFPYYDIQDINADGVPDLILSEGPDGYCTAYTVKRGLFCTLFNRRFLCQDQVLEYLNEFFDPDQGAFEEFTFTRMEGGREVLHDLVRHNLSADTWYSRADRVGITEAQAKAVLSQYPRLDLELKPIGELKK